jgi:putative tricarboxylic transport membrane protein
MLLGITLGVLIGVLPGLGGANGVAILLPLTFSMNPTSAIIMLSCIYWGALFGGAITSILFNIPGEPWSVATTFDGYPMAQQGRAGEALTAAFTSSFVGAFFAVLLITFLAPLLAKFALKFGPAGVLRGAAADLLQLRRHEQGPPGQDPGGDDARLRAGRGRHGHRDRPLRMTFGVPNCSRASTS